MSRAHQTIAVSVLTVLLGCGGGGGSIVVPPPPPPSGVTLAKASPSGDGQTGATSATLPNPLRVIATQTGNPAAGRTVTWAITPNSGEVNPSSSTTDANGIASTTVTLPSVSGTATITATSAGATGSPQSFSATATGASSAVNVQVVNTSFVPSVFTLQVNGTVTFTWGAGSGPHNVTPVAPNTIPISINPGPPDTHAAPYSFQTTFPAVGTYKFFCSVHGGPDSGMSGTITVVP